MLERAIDPDLRWGAWLETQVSPPVGLPMPRCDCVAELRSVSGTQPPWACRIEVQAQPLPRLAVWVMVYLGLLYQDLRHGPSPCQGTRHSRPGFWKRP